MIFYLCDGNVEECKKDCCYYLNGGNCKYTSKIENAKNFKVGINELDFFEVDFRNEKMTKTQVLKTL